MTARRLWWCATLLAVLLVAGESVLIGRALAAIGREERLEHERVAARVAAEIDRRLGGIVAEEEQRPFTHYRYFCVPAGSVPGSLALEVSPLAAPPAVPWLVGHFQIDPDGSFHSPLRPRNEELARLATKWGETPAVAAALAELERLTAGQRIAAAHATVAKPAPTATPVGGPAAEDPYRLAENGSRAQSLTEVEGSLNKLGNRQGRGSSVQAQARSVYNFQNDRDNALQRGLVASNAPAQEDDVQQVNCRVQQEVQAAFDTADSAVMEVAQGPLHRLALDGGELVLGREVRVAGLRYLQGFAVRLDALGAAVADDVLGEADLGDVLAVRFDGADRALPGYAYALRHPCAEPFADLVATLHLRALPGAVPGARRTVWWLGIALVAATALGVWALAGMVAAALRFARRRQDFVAAVSHELKTPLTAIRLHAEMLRDGMVADEAKRQQYHGTIVAESERLSRLIGNVLELARLEHDDRPMQPQIGDPMAVLAEVVRIVAPHAAAHGFAITLQGQTSAPSARFDRDALLQVVMNLVDNAIKFAGAATDRRIELVYAAGSDGPAITVRDHGPGVPSADLRRVFQPFWRGERELTRTTTGTGIGLALVQGLVERMGGQVRVRNHPDGGFEVQVRLVPAG